MCVINYLLVLLVLILPINDRFILVKRGSVLLLIFIDATCFTSIWYQSMVMVGFALSRHLLGILPLSCI